MPVGDLLPELAVLLTAVATLLVAAFVGQGRQWLCAPLALAGLIAGIVLAAGQLDAARLTFSGVFALDGAATWARLAILGLTAVTVLLVPHWLAGDRRHGEYYTILLLSALGAMVLAGAADLLQLVVAVLLSSVTGYTLAAYHRDWPLSVEAGMKYFLIGAFANALLAVGVALVFGLLGTSDYARLADTLQHGVTASPLLLLGVALIVVGVAFKLAAVPAHSWMADVAEGAPVPSAVFLTVVPKIAAAIALARLVALFPPETLGVRPLIALLAVATMTYGNLAALWQDDVRRLVGWSSVSQSGYALMAVCVVGLSAQAVPALLFFLIGYAIATLAAFAAIGHLRGRTDLAHYAGLAASRPVAAAVLILAFLSMVGIPPLAGFVGKLTLFVATIDGGYAWLAVVAVINTVISLFYYLRVAGAMVFQPACAPAAVLGAPSAVATWLSGLAVIAGGLAAGPLLQAFATARLLP
jgi:NADH-quinone oxidoreductase subunit N